MNKAIKVLGFITLFFLILGSLFKSLFWPGGSFITTVGVFIFITGFLPLFGIQRFKRSKTNLEKVTAILGACSLFLIFNGFMFRINHWPGGSFSLIVGMYSFCFAVLPMFIFSEVKSTDKKIVEIISLVLISACAIAFLLLYPTRYSRDTLDTLVTVSKNQQHSLNSKDIILKTYDNYLKDSTHNYHGLNELNAHISNLISVVEDIQRELIYISEESNETEVYLNNPELIYGQDNVDIVNFVMIGENISSSNKNAAYLKDHINDFKDYIISANKSGEISISPIVLEQLDNLLSTDDVKEYNGIRTWEEHMFYSTSLIGAIVILNNIKDNIKTIELLIKSEIVNNNNAK